MQTLFWYDYETWSLSPHLPPAQLAAIRTNMNLEIIDEPINIHCQPSKEFIPSLQAVALTGITPQFCAQNGLNEFEFFNTIYLQMARQYTCSVGYNSIRFDDEFSRYGFYRNFIPIYDREWKNGCSRWDIIDLVRMCFALRPTGINWVYKDNKPIFKLEELTKANGIQHDSPHDALNDVYASIAITKLIKQHQPRLFAYYFQCRNKYHVTRILQAFDKKIFLHISSKYPASEGCIAPVMTIYRSTVNPNKTWIFNLRYNPSSLVTMDVTAIKQNLYTPTTELHQPRISIKGLHINRSPAIAPYSMLTPDLAERHQLDQQQISTHAQILIELLQDDKFMAKMQQLDRLLHDLPEKPKTETAEQSLYDGFFTNKDQRLINDVYKLALNNPTNLVNEYLSKQIVFADSRLNEILPRFIARNFYQLCDDQLKNNHNNYCQTNLLVSMQQYEADKINFKQTLQKNGNNCLDAHIKILDLWNTALLDSLGNKNL